MSLVTDPNTVQASHFVSALREQLREMTPKLVRAERELARGHAGRARAMRVEAAELRADIGLAQSLIDRLHRRFPGLDVAASPTRQASVPVNSAPGGDPDAKACGERERQRISAHQRRIFAVGRPVTPHYGAHGRFGSEMYRGD
jgi:hypothetical protein